MRGLIYGLLGASIWGSVYVVSDVVLPVVPPFTLLTLRLVQGALALALIWAWQVRARPAPQAVGGGPGLRLPDRAQTLRLLGVGALGMGISIGAQFVGTDRSNAVNGVLITSAAPAFILLFAALLLRERFSARRLTAIALATIGVVLIVDLGQADFGSETFTGNLVLVGAAVSWGLYSVLVRGVSADHDTLIVTLYSLLGGLLISVPAALLELQSRPLGEVTPLIGLGVLHLGVVSTALSNWLWNRAFALLPAAQASLCFFAQPLVGTLLGVTLLAQPLTPPILLGGLLIGSGILVSLREPAQ